MKDNQTKRFERFKAELLKWKKANAEKYAIFSEKMNTNTEIGLLELGQILSKELRQLCKAWQRRWNDDSTDGFEEMTEIVKNSDILKNWVESVRTNTIIVESCYGQLCLCWIVYGQMFETVIRFLEKLKTSKDINIIKRRFFFPIIIKWAIFASISSGYRTKNDWNRYFKLAKAYKDDAAIGEIVWNELCEEAENEQSLEILEEAKIALEEAKRQKDILEIQLEEARAENEESDRTVRHLTEANTRLETENAKMTEEKISTDSIVSGLVFDKIEAESRLEQLSVENSQKQQKIESLETELEYERNRKKPQPGRNKAKELPLSEYLNSCRNKPAVLEVIGEYIRMNSTGMQVALSLAALRELGFIDGLKANAEYYNALVMQFPDVDLKKSTCEHALGDVQKVQDIYRNGIRCKGLPQEDDKYAAIYANLIEKLKSAESDNM